MPSTVEEALAVFIDAWNQFGPSDSPGFGTNWTSDPATVWQVSSAFGALSNSWASDTTDSQIQDALDSGGVPIGLLDFEAPNRAFLELIQRGANVQSSEVRNWFVNSGVDWDSATIVLGSAPLSVLTQSLGWALGDPQESGGDMLSLAAGILIGGSMADQLSLGSQSQSPDTAAGALAFQLANMAMA